VKHAEGPEDDTFSFSAFVCMKTQRVTGAVASGRWEKGGRSAGHGLVHEAYANSVDPAGWLAEQIGACGPDVLRSMVKTLAEALMSGARRGLRGQAIGSARTSGSTAATATGPGIGTPAPGTVELAFPKLRSGVVLLLCL
jgi:hypothetical protein